ncbi:MAG: hypothetical protein FD167_583 [bacterium]|nr:MAG: hypothetical protein FD167_583 [bacterium]
MSRVIKRFLFVVPMLACMFAFSSVGQQANASSNTSTNKIIKTLGEVSSNRLSLCSRCHSSFGFELNGCYWQVETEFDAAGIVVCGTTVVFCENSVQIYTAGTNCS